MGNRRSFDESMLERLRRMPSDQVLRRLAIHLKPDRTYVPPELKAIAPALAKHVYSVHRRVVMSDGLNP